MRFLMTFAFCALVVGQAAAAPTPKLGDWVFSQNFKSQGPNVCSLRFATLPNAPTLTVQNRTAKTSRTQAFFVVGGLPPLLSGKSGVIQGVELQLGSWDAGYRPANWNRGSDTNNSSIAVDSGVPIATTVQNLSSSGAVSVNFALRSGPQSYTFATRGIEAALPAFTSCIHGLT